MYDAVFWGFSLNIDGKVREELLTFKNETVQKNYPSFSLVFRAETCSFWEIFKKQKCHGLISHLWSLSSAFWFYSCVYVLYHESTFESLLSSSQTRICRLLTAVALVMTVLQYIQGAFSLGTQEAYGWLIQDHPCLNRGLWAMVSRSFWASGLGPRAFQGSFQGGWWSFCLSFIRSISVSVCLVY